MNLTSFSKGIKITNRFVLVRKWLSKFLINDFITYTPLIIDVMN